MAIELIKGSSLLLALCLLQGFARRYWQQNELIGQSVSGTLFGMICVIGMMTPIQLHPGVIFDARSVVLAMAGLFGGPIVAAIGGGIAGAYRLWLGGTGSYVGLGVIVSCISLGLIYRYLHLRGKLHIGIVQYFAFGLIVHIVSVAWFAFLPAGISEDVIRNIALPFITIFTFATVLLGLLLQDVEDRLNVESALRKSERKSRAILNQTFQFMGLMSTQGILLDANRSSLQFANINSADVLGKPLWETPWWSHSTQAQKDLKNAVKRAREGELVRFATTHMKQDGTLADIDFSVKPAYDAEGNVEFLIPEGRDITEQKNSEKAMQQAVEEIGRSSKAKSDFLASMSHELRTPLNAVIGFAQMLQYVPSEPLSSKQKEYADYIVEGGEHLLKLVNEILDLSIIESNMYSLTVEKVDANKLVADCLEMTALLSNEKNLKITNNFNNQETVLLGTDPIRMKQVILNLLSNAFKYNKLNGSVCVEGQTTDDGFLRLVIKDTGIGIPQNRQSNMFQMFDRHSHDAHIAQEGTGLGLTVSKLLVERMGGEIGFESEEGKGSSFWVRVPLASNKNILIWSDSLKVGVDAIDRDHQKLVSLSNQCSRSSLQDEEIGRVIDDLINYTQFHFTREEEIMKVCGYKDIEAHKDKHRSLIAQVNEYSKSWQTNHDKSTLNGLKTFLRGWLFEHIMHTDVELAAFCEGKSHAIESALHQQAIPKDVLDIH